MIGLGTIINTDLIIVGGILGRLFGHWIKAAHQEALTKICGVSVLFIGIAGAMEGMLKVEGVSITAGKSMLIVLCLALGTILGEIINIENWFERFGEWLKIKTGNSSDKDFVNAFVTTSLTVCIGAMAIVGSIQDGVQGDYSTLAVKGVLDCIFVMVMSTSLGKGCIFSAIPVFVIQGIMTILARFVAPVLSELAVSYLSMVGSIIIFCVGINLVWGKMYRVANMIPAVIFAVIAAYLPINF